MRKNVMFLLMCIFAIGINSNPVRAVGNVRNVKQAVGYEWEPLLFSSDQIRVNSCAPKEGGYVECLIDGDINTLVHTVWSAGMKRSDITEEEWLEELKEYGESPVNPGEPLNTDAGYHFVQVDLEKELSAFRFSYKGRNDDFWHDNPNHIIIYGTNDDNLGSRATNKDQNRWTKIVELTPKSGRFPQNVKVVESPYMSPIVKTEKPFRYLRFVVKGTTFMGKTGDRTFNNPDVTGITWGMSEFQVYEGVPSDDITVILSTLVDSVKSEVASREFQIGKDPGYTNESVYNSYKMCLKTCEDAVRRGEKNEVLLKRYCRNLRTSINRLINEGSIPVETGYYFIETAFDAFRDKQYVTKSLCVDKNREFGWNTTNQADPTQLWYVEKLSNGFYSIRNIATNEYIGTVKGEGQRVPMTAKHEVDQTFELEESAPGQFHIANIYNDADYHAGGHMDGKGLNGWTVTWEGDANSPSVWYMKHVTDQKQIDRLVKRAEIAMLRMYLKDALAKAESLLKNTVEYKPLITDASQLSSNAESVSGDGSNLKHLIDGNNGSIFHSIWSDAFQTPTPDGTSHGWHNLQVRFDEPVSKIKFYYQGRENENGWHDTPDRIVLYGTNDETLGNSTAAADSSQWTEIVDMTRKDYRFPKDVSLAQFHSPDMDLGGSYKYLRFVVKHTTTMESGHNRYGKFASPSATGVTFNLSEFQIYETTPADYSQYYTVNGMKDACDKLQLVAKEVKANVSIGRYKKEDAEKIAAALSGVESIYVDRPAMFGKLSSLLREADEKYNIAIGERVPLIMKADQMRSNSNDANEGGKLDNLIDRNLTTSVHSVWAVEMGNPDMTEDQWLAILGDRFPGADGVGYHNLQVELAVPQKSFFFEFFGRIGTDYHDNPTDIEVYATNDAELASDVRDERTSEWTFIKKLNEGFPGNVEIKTVPYISPVIDLGGEYKFIRFVVKNTSLANANVVANREFKNPDITGVTWNLSEFQMYTGLDPESIQYNYIEEVRVAADELKVIIEKLSGLSEKDLISDKPITELQSALDKLLAAYVDTADVVKLYNKYKALVPATEEGVGIGYVDSDESTNAFDVALDEARSVISPKQPTREQVDQSTAMLRNAYKEFVSHIGTVQPYVWYNINSTSTREWATDQPIHLQSTDLDASLKIGGYPLGIETTDVYAIWRLVPIEGKEGQYAIQSLGTGQYFGPYRGDGSGVEPVMSHEKTPYVVEYCGRAAFNIRQASVENEMDNLKTDGTNRIVLNWPSNGDYQQEWRFVDVAAETDVIGINRYPENNVNIITLPWANKGTTLADYNPGIETYGLNNVVSTDGADGGKAAITLTLTRKDEFEAGEPMVLVTPASEDGTGQCPLSFALPATEANAIVDTAAVAYNGLTGTLQGENIRTAVKLYFRNSALALCNDAPVWIPARSGWIDATQVTDLQGSIDKTITIGGMINGVENVVVEDPNALVNVFTVDGVMVKQNVKAADATKNLAKGIYIVGKKKVLVK